ncbi:MAG TPA: hypothetical protein VGM05_22465 [Planctomycetaceae bacterium]|jgi:hypothetical protein
MKRFLIMAALVGGALLASTPTDAMAHTWRWYARRGYYGAYYAGPVVHSRHYRRPAVVVQTPGYYAAPVYGNVYYAP